MYEISGQSICELLRIEFCIIIVLLFEYRIGRSRPNRTKQHVRIDKCFFEVVKDLDWRALQDRKARL